MSRSDRFTILALACLLGGASVAAEVGAQQTFRACYVPQVGAMYLLDLPGLPTACLSEAHEVIEWTDGETSSGPIGTDDIEDGAVTAAKIAAGVLEGAVLGAGSVGSNEIADGQVLEADIGVESVNGDHIQFGAVGSADIATGAVQSYHIANGAVGTLKLAVGAVDGAAIATGAVGPTDLAPNAVSGVHLDLRMEEASGLAVEQANNSVRRTVQCTDGRVAISGGWSVESGEIFMRESFRSAPNAWTFRAANVGTEIGRFTLHVICLDLD